MGEDYLGIKIFRFYFHCKNCGAEITMKTDPKNSDYAMEQGATRNYEPWREKEKVSCSDQEFEGSLIAICNALPIKTLQSTGVGCLRKDSACDSRCRMVCRYM